MSDRFNAEAGLIRAFMELGAQDSKKIDFLEGQLQDAYRFIAYLINRFGEDRFDKRVVHVSHRDLIDAPMYTGIIRWEDLENGGICLGVRKNESA